MRKRLSRAGVNLLATAGKLARWCAARASGLLAVGSLAAISIGCGMERLSLGLIVPGVIVFGCLVWGRLRADDVRDPVPPETPRRD